ncbi:hypothetical protein FI667_g8544, partial [Globisporangium splendens]
MNEDDEYERGLRDEGGGGLAGLKKAEAATGSGDSRETLQIAFHEQFAIAQSMHEKRDVVHAALLPGTPDALYYSALCDLHELQLLLLDGTQGDGGTEEEHNEGDEGADAVTKAVQFVEQNRAKLMKWSNSFVPSSAARKRREWNSACCCWNWSCGVEFRDRLKRAETQTASNSLLDINVIVADMIQTWTPLTDEQSLGDSASSALSALDTYARELVFNHLLHNTGGMSMTDVSQELTRVDLSSWRNVAVRGSVDEVVQCLSGQKGMLSVDLGLVLWRCKDIVFYNGLISSLRDEMIYNEGVWKCAFVHNDLDAIKEYLRSATSLTKTAGLGLSTTFFSTTELFSYLSNDGFGHTEFGPFLHRRVHEAKGSVPAMGSATGISTNGGRILNKNARAFYHALRCRLEMFTTLGGQQLLVLAYFMLLFNRMEDAMHLFSRLQALPPSKKTTVENTVQFDYVDSYLDLFRDQDDHNFAVARRNVAKYKKHPHAWWRERFVRLDEFVAEYDAFEDHKVNQAVHESLQISGSAFANEREVADLPPAPLESRTLQVKLDAVVSDGKIHVSSRHLGECEISFYPIDVEFMFSTKPFDTFSNSSTSTSSVLLVQPRHRMSVKLALTPSGNSPAQTEVSIPQELQGQQMMVRVREATESREIESAAAPIDVVRLCFNSSLQVDVMKQSGMLQVFHKGFPVSRCCVKVYAKVSSSSSAAAQFYKDGYTDLLGKFDYVGINGELVARVERFSILTSHPKFGASVHQSDPPVLATTATDFQHQETHEMLLY